MEIARAFEGRVRGRVRTDRITRELYSTDASPYRVRPAAVLVPEVVDDLGTAVDVCREIGLSITPRGAGTSFTGQCVGEGLAVDCGGLDALGLAFVGGQALVQAFAAEEQGAVHERRVLDRFAVAGRYAPEFDAVGNDHERMRELAARSTG